jgi:riboflavin kinase/FMN adenylyltransferase
MRFRSRLETLPEASAVAIGNFDGFHAGHRRIIETLAEAARCQGLQSVVLTFHPHPRIFFGQEIRLISTDRQRLELLKGQALDRLFFLDFASVAFCPAGDFVRDILLGSLRLKILVVGEDFRFGRGREGDLEFLGRQAAARQFTLIQATGVEFDGCRVTSSRIRKKLAAGAIREANRMLEKPYFIDGIVVRGAGRGKALGFPTMNIASDNAILPRGVFHTQLGIAGRRYASVTNIGSAPTFRSPAGPAHGGLTPKGSAQRGLRVETHIPGFRSMVYGKKIRLHFIDKIRSERQFANSGDLAEQIRRDIAFLGI